MLGRIPTYGIPHQEHTSTSHKQKVQHFYLLHFTNKITGLLPDKIIRQFFYGNTTFKVTSSVAVEAFST